MLVLMVIYCFKVFIRPSVYLSICSHLRFLWSALDRCFVTIHSVEGYYAN